MSAKDKKSEVFSYFKKSNVNLLLVVILFIRTKGFKGDCIINVIAELTFQVNWNACKRCRWDRTISNIIGELTLQTKPVTNSTVQKRF